MGKFRDALQGQAAKGRAKREKQKQEWTDKRQALADEATALKGVHPLIHEAVRAWKRGDAVYVHRTSQSIANYKFEQKIINAEVNAITALGWELSATSTKLGAVIFTFVRPPGTAREPTDR